MLRREVNIWYIITIPTTEFEGGKVMNMEPERLVKIETEKVEETAEEKKRFEKIRIICNHILTLMIIVDIILYSIGSLRGTVLEGEPSEIFFSKADEQIQEQVDTYVLEQGITSENLKIEITGGFEHYSAMKHDNRALSLALLVKGGALVNESIKPRIMYWVAAAFMYFANGYNIEHSVYEYDVVVTDGDRDIATGTCVQPKNKVYCEFER